MLTIRHARHRMRCLRHGHRWHHYERLSGDLVISGEITSSERGGVLRRATRRQGRFEYRTMLPADADPDQVSASLADGVLTVRVAKAETARPRRIEITAG